MIQPAIQYCIACWEWLYGRAQKPIPKDFGVDDSLADAIYRQCYIEYSAKCRSKPQDSSNVLRPQSSEVGPKQGTIL